VVRFPPQQVFIPRRDKWLQAMRLRVTSCFNSCGAPATAPRRTIHHGFFAAGPSTVEIRPGGDSLTHGDPARIEFSQDKIARIVSLRDNGEFAEYRLDPQLIANVAENREKRTLVRFNDIPKSLVDAVIAVEDQALLQHMSDSTPFASSRRRTSICVTAASNRARPR
jgi:penicillin-binding protein 1B